MSSLVARQAPQSEAVTVRPDDGTETIRRSDYRGERVALRDDCPALRGLFLIDREGRVRHALLNDPPPGRNADAALRTLDALRHKQEHGRV